MKKPKKPTKGSGGKNGNEEAEERRRLEEESRNQEKREVLPHILLGELAFEKLGDVMFVGQDLWRYRGGRWRVTEGTENVALILNMIIEQCGQQYVPGYKGKAATVNEARRWMLRQEKYLHEEIEWDNHGMVPMVNGLYDPETRRFIPHAPEHHTTQWAPVEYHAEAKCPMWLQFLADMFDQLTIDLLQEAIGMAVYKGKRPKDLARAILFHGTSNSGKTQMVNVIRGLITDDPVTTAVDKLEGNHGTSAFWRNTPWILHEAFDQSKWHFSSLVKAIIEGETIEINRKNRDAYTMHYTAPVIWAANAAPQFKEATKAIINRLLIFGCLKVFDQDNPVGVAKIAADKGYKYTWEMLLAEEGPGILNWAIAGMHRALDRGHYILTHESKEALDEVYLESNLCARWVDDNCVVVDQKYKVRPADAHASFAAHYAMNYGESSHTPSQQAFTRALKALNKGFVFGEEARVHGIRFIGAMRLTEAGLDLWSQVKDEGILQNRQIGLSSAREVVNKVWARTFGGYGTAPTPEGAGED